MSNSHKLFFALAGALLIVVGCGGQGANGFNTTSSTAGSLGLNGQPMAGPIGGGKPGGPAQAMGGDELMFAQVAEDGLEISLASPTSKSIGALTRLPAGQTLYAQSPTGALVAFATSKDNVLGLYVNTSNSLDHAVQIGASNYTSLGGVQFSPDGKRVVFTGAQAGSQSAVYVANVDGKGFRKVDDGDDANISPDGRRIVYSKMVSGTSKVFVIGFDGKGGKALTTDKQNELLPQFTKDGKRVLFTCVGNEGMSVHSAPASGGKATKLALGYGATGSPDSKQIAFSRISSNPEESGIFVAQSDGKSPSKIADSPALASPLYWTVPSSGPGRNASQPGAPSASMSARAMVLLKLPAAKPLPAVKAPEPVKNPEAKPDKDGKAGG